MSLARALFSLALTCFLVFKAPPEFQARELALLALMFLLDGSSKILNSKDVGRVAPLLGLFVAVQSPASVLGVVFVLVLGASLFLKSAKEFPDAFSTCGPVVAAALTQALSSQEQTSLWPGLVFLGVSLFFEFPQKSLNVPILALVSAPGLLLAFQVFWPQNYLALAALLPALVGLAFGGNLQRTVVSRFRGALTQKDSEIAKVQERHLESEKRVEQLSLLLKSANLMSRTLVEKELSDSFAQALAQIGVGEWKFVQAGKGDVSLPSQDRDIRFKRGLSGGKRPVVEVLLRIYATCRENVALHRQAKEALEETKRSQEQMIASHKLAGMGRLAAGVAHEMNSPLGAILLTAEFAKSLLSDDDRPVTEKLDRIIESTQLAQANVSRLLEYSRPESKTAPSVLKLSQVVADAARLLDDTASKSKVDVEVKVDPEARVLMNQQSLHILISNLILNGIHAATGSEEHKVSVTHKREQDFHLLAVEDTGPGVPPEAQKELFTPFFTTKPLGEGNGLGLHLAQQAVTEAGGGLQFVGNRPGARFVARIPVAGGS